MPEPLLVAGASHQGEVVLDLLRSLPAVPRVLGFLDCGKERRFVGRTVAGLPVMDCLEALGTYAGQVGGVIPAVGKGAEREEITAVVERHGIPLVSAVHPQAIVAEGVELGPGTVVCAGAIVGTGARIGRAVIINTGAIIEHHCRICDYAHVAPGACIAGHVRVGERAWIGLGARVLEDRAIGCDAVVGAGAVVTRDVDAGHVVVGVPARSVGEPDLYVEESDPA